MQYKVDVAIGTGYLIRVHDLFPCRAFNDLAIHHLEVKNATRSGERAVADGGYRDETCSISQNPESVSWGFVRARHGAVNKRLKHFNVLSHRFRHNFKLYSKCCFEVANITQLLIMNGEANFNIF